MPAALIASLTLAHVDPAGMVTAVAGPPPNDIEREPPLTLYTGVIAVLATLLSPVPAASVVVTATEIFPATDGGATESIIL